MKNMFLLVVFGLLQATVIAQTDQKNLEKYWKFRSSFTKDFIRIGKEQGESLPIIGRVLENVQIMHLVGQKVCCFGEME